MLAVSEITVDPHRPGQRGPRSTDRRCSGYFRRNPKAIGTREAKKNRGIACIACKGIGLHKSSSRSWTANTICGRPSKLHWSISGQKIYLVLL